MSSVSPRWASIRRRADRPAASLDGYPYINFALNPPDKKTNVWPRYTHAVDEKDLRQCSLDYDTCFTDGEHKQFTSASEVFKNIAFRQPRCGDCSTHSDRTFHRQLC